MGLKLYEGPDAWRLEIEGLAHWPSQGIQGCLLHEKGKGGEIAFYPPFREKPVGEGLEAVLAEYQGKAFRIEKTLTCGEVPQTERDSYLTRLRAFPAGLPDQIVSPEKAIMLRLGGNDLIIGHVQQYVPEAVELGSMLQPAFRRENGIKNSHLTQVLLSLLDGLNALHAKGCVRAEINPANFGVVGEKVFFFDVLGMSFAGFPCCTVFPACVDPLLLNPDCKLMKCQPEAWQLRRPYSRASDHYSFSVLVFTAFTGKGPWSGTHKRGMEEPVLMGERARAILRIPATSPDVIPDWNIPPEVMSEAMRNHLDKVFQEGFRGPFGRSLLADLDWQFCSHCQLEYAGYTCPCTKSRRQVPVAVPDKPADKHFLSAILEFFPMS